jgi:hypothetical protein
MNIFLNGRLKGNRLKVKLASGNAEAIIGKEVIVTYLPEIRVERIRGSSPTLFKAVRMRTRSITEFNGQDVDIDGIILPQDTDLPLHVTITGIHTDLSVEQRERFRREVTGRKSPS